MADYYPLLTRAIATLPDQDPAKRQAIYRRAREALERQLRGIDPPLGEADIMKETLALEDVIRRIEADFAELPPPDAGAESKTDEKSTDEKSAAEAVSEPSADTTPEAEAKPDDAPAPVAIQPARSRQPERPKAETRQEKEQGRRRLGLIAVAGCFVLMAMGTFAYLKREDPRAYRNATPQAEAPKPAEPDQAKREGRLAGGPEPVPQRPVEPSRPAQPSQPAQAPANGQALPVASRAFMVLEVPGGAPNQFEGQATWSFAPDPASRSNDRAVRAVVNYTGASLSIDLTISRNRDPQIKSSHTIFVSFDPKQALPAVREMSAIEWRERESQTGATMTGVLVPIQDNVFLIGLDPAEASIQRNMDLLRSQRWMVFEVRLANGRRGAFLIEKGSSGEKAVADALAAWK